MRLECFESGPHVGVGGLSARSGGCAPPTNVRFPTLRYGVLHCGKIDNYRGSLSLCEGLRRES